VFANFNDIFMGKCRSRTPKRLTGAAQGHDPRGVIFDTVGNESDEEQ
jgi:hypothetical protein